MKSTVPPIAAVMVHVTDVNAALRWYTDAFLEAVPLSIGSPAFECLSVHGVLLELVPADAKVGAGAFGSVVYWNVADFDAALAHLQSCGAALYRGPLRLEGDEHMAQVRDPWGNCIGLRGPSAGRRQCAP
ncbi:VOC family protein [Acidovorax cavernicola]|nr:VOC family protein [Acidovorax cavernicola]